MNIVRAFSVWSAKHFTFLHDMGQKADYQKSASVDCSFEKKRGIFLFIPLDSGQYFAVSYTRYIICCVIVRWCVHQQCIDINFHDDMDVRIYVI